MNKFSNFIISSDATILSALKKLSKVQDVSKLILFVIDKNKRVIGTLTDGDIRRSLIKNESLDLNIFEICNKNFEYLRDNNKYVDLKKIKKDKQSIKMLPVLNDNMEFIDLIDLSKTKSILPLEAFIMAGGRGKRLSPLTDEIPKPMLPIMDKPIIEFIIDNLISHGIKKIYISINYKGEIIEKYFGDGSDKNIEIIYIREDSPLGTAGSLSLVKSFQHKNIILINGDLFTNINFEKMYVEMQNKNAVMAVSTKDYRIDIPYAIFETNESKVISFKEKPTYIFNSNAGIYMIKSSLINNIPKNKFFDITDFMESLIKINKTIINVPISGYWFDIGRPDDYHKVCDFVKHFNY